VVRRNSADDTTTKAFPAGMPIMRDTTMAKNKTDSFAADDFDPSNVKVAKQLIYPTLKIEPDAVNFVKVLEPMSEGRQIEEEGNGKRGPATILKVTVLHAGPKHELNGKDAQIVANKLLVGTLRDSYPDDNYVGRSFRIVKSHDKKKGKNGDYYTFSVDEIEA
jgi:hypothetical protein